MEHFLYVIEEKDTDSEICSTEVINELYMGDMIIEENDSSEKAAVELDYQLNTTVPSLNKIMEYYNIPTRENRRELKKNDKVKRIVDFETDDVNKEIVKKRKRYWEYVNESNDDYFKKFIVIDL